MVDKPIIFVIGGPGSGKGTQCEKIVEKYKFTHISTGDILREASLEKGNELSRIMQNGQLVPMKEVLKLLKNKLKSENQTSKGFLIDGYPREVDQAIEFEKDISKCVFVFYFDVNENIMMERLIERGKTSGRIDDNQQTIRKRLQTFYEHTNPILEHFNDRIVKINCERSVDEIFNDVCKTIDTFCKI